MLGAHGYITTFTGRRFWPLDPRVEDIDIRDIAHALSMQCRFGGHTTELYSVAQHSIWVSNQVKSKERLWGLLHDAAEAYLVDLPSPIKRQPELAPYRDAEAAIMRAVCDAFGLPHEQPASVTEADHRMLVTEARDLTNWSKDTFADWTQLGEPYPFNVWPLHHSVAESMFLRAFENATRIAA